MPHFTDGETEPGDSEVRSERPRGSRMESGSQSDLSAKAEGLAKSITAEFRK